MLDKLYHGICNKANHGQTGLLLPDSQYKNQAV